MSKRVLTSIDANWGQLLKKNELNKKYGALGWLETQDGFYVVMIPKDAKFEGV